MKIYFTNESGLPISDKITRYHILSFENFSDLVFYWKDNLQFVFENEKDVPLQLIGDQTTSQMLIQAKLLFSFLSKIVLLEDVG